MSQQETKQEIKKNNKHKNKEEEPKEEKKKDRPLYDKYKRDLDISQFMMKKAIDSVDSWVLDVENHRNYKMESDFNKEKDFKMLEQNEIKNQIEELSSNSDNELQIQYINSKISEQQELYDNYSNMNDKILLRIKELKENIPSLENTVKEYSKELKKINKENLKIMDQISMIEREINYHNSLGENHNSTNVSNSYNNKTNVSNILDSSRNQSYSLINNDNNFSKSNIMNSNISSLGNKNKSRESINLNEIMEENEEIKNQYIQILQLKKIYKSKKKENKILLKNIADMNTECFTYKRIFNEGIHEIAKELLKLHEMQLDKVINNKGKNKSNINSIYFEMVKSNDKKNDTLFKLPKINDNIMKKYKFPINEKRTPETLIFNVIKKMVNESHNLNKAINLKKNKFSWEEFKTFSAYQIYTILNLNKKAIQKLESYIFPNRIVYPLESN